MAKQTSALQIEGTLGNLCFYKTKDGYLVRAKGSVSKSRIKYHPAYARVRENNAEFARAVQAGKLFRNAFRPLIGRAGLKGVSGSLMRTMMKVIKSDPVNTRGQRTVKDGETRILEGFEFNEKVALRAPFSASIDRETGAMIIDIEAFSPATMMSAPEGATHFRFYSGGAAIDFETNAYNLATSETAYVPIREESIGRLQLIQKVEPRSSDTLFLLLGIEFVSVVNGVQKPLRNEAFSALAIVRVSNR